MLKKSLLIMLLMACMAPWAVGQTREIVYQKVTTAPDDWTAGSYLLVYDNSKAATNSTTTSGSTIYLNTVSVTVESNTIENPNGAEVITLELYTTGKYYIKNSEGKFLKAIRSGSGSTKYPQFSWVTTSDAYNCVWQFAYNNGNITLKWENNNDYKMAVSGNYITLASSASNFSLFAQANVQIDYPKPTGLDVTDLGSTTATLSWTAPTSSPKEGYSLTGYEYKEANAASWSSVITTTSCDLEGLTANTEYTYQVVAVYTNNNDETDIQDSDPVSITFTTDCAELSVPTQTWNFDDGTMPDCWTIASTYVYSGNTYPRVYNNGSGYSYSTSYALQFGGTTSTVLMPAINETVNGKTLSFYTRVGYVSGTPQLLIGYIDNTNAFITKETVTVTASFTKQEIDLTGFPSDIRKIALHSNISSSQIYVDDIKIEVTSGCKPVKNLSVGTITANSAKLKWTAGNAETNWKLQYKTSAAENYSTVNVSSTDLDSDGYYTLGSLADNTTYNWQVAAWCDPTVPTAITDYVSGTNFTTIQTPVVVDADHDFSDNFEDANNWVFVNGTQTNKWVIGTAAHNGEGSTKALYISNDGGTTHAYSGTSSTTYVTKSITFAAGTYNFQYDWICNGEKSSYGTVYDYFRVALAPATTTLTAGTTTITYNNVPSGWIALDGGALVQQNSWTTKTVNDVEISSGTYLLVFMWTNDSQVYQVPAGVDNFSITAVSCAAPTALAESNVRSNSATFTWTKGGTETNWTLQYAENNTFSTGLVEVTEGFTIDGTNVSYSATGLKAGQIYYVRVKANCSANDESAFCDAINFTTLAILPPTNLPVSDITTTSARLNWTGVSTNDGHSSYEVCYSTTNSVPSTLTPNENYFTGITATNKTLSGLTSGTTYYAWVRDICGTNSTWAAFNSFNTDCENVTTFPFIQDFESLSVNYTIPVCWDNNDGTTTNDNYKWCYTTVTGTSNKGNTNGTGHNNSNCVRFDSYDSSDGETNFLSTPTIVLSDKIVVLEFWYKNPNGGDLSVFINDGSDHELATGLTGASNWIKKDIIISDDYKNKNVVFRFKGTSNWGNSDAYIYLDDVSVSVYDEAIEEGGWPTTSAPTIEDEVFINGDVTVTANTIAYAKDITLADGASLTIEDGGQLICSNSVAVSMAKETEAWDATNNEGWYAISSPVNGISVADFVKGDDHNVYSYIEATNYWNEYRNPSTENGCAQFGFLTNGRGYLYRSTAEDVMFTGNSNVGTVNYTLSYANENDNFKGFNLIGNPFTHDIYKNDVAQEEGDLPAINSDKLAYGYYRLGTDGNWTGTIGYNNPIKAGEAVLVKATAGFDLTITNTNNPAAEFTEQSSKSGNDNIVFTVKNSKYTDVAYAMFNEGVGLNKIDHYNNDIQMLYISQNDADYAIATMPDDTRVINLGFEAKTMSQYSISLKAQGNFSYMHLYDKLTGEDVDMLIEDSYSFIGTPNDRKDRFVLRLTYNASIEEVEANEAFVYQSGSDIIVNGEGELQVFDMMGRKVMTQHINGTETVNMNANGVFIFKMNGMTQKVVVR